MLNPRRALPLLLPWALAPTLAAAQTGVSDDRVALPSGPGSIDGAGDNTSLELNQGGFRYSFPLELPAGQRGTAPRVSLGYDSGAGAGLVGIGFRLDLPTIERSALRGLPEYDVDDEIVASGSTQLVPVQVDADRRTYRARFESGFVRYTWHGAGEAGYWRAEYPGGQVAFFGATAEGRAVPEARLADARGRTFRWYLVEEQDPWGHAVRYVYEGASPRPAAVTWGFGASGRATYELRFAYGARPDLISDCSGGFEERVDRRLEGLTLLARGQQVRRWVLSYESAERAGGLSRVASIETRGRDDSVYPVVPRFTWTRALGAACTGSDCARPFVADMGSLSGGLGVGTGAMTLVDLDGNGLPDIVDGSQAGGLRIFTSAWVGPGRARFGDAARVSTRADRTAFPLGDPRVQVLDLDGNGLADLLNAGTGRALCNMGSGDFSQDCQLTAGMDVQLESDVDDGDLDPAHTRFVDLDGDKRIDLLRTAGGLTVARVLRPQGYVTLPAEPVGADFDTDQLELADLNGDGLLDLVRIADDASVRYRLALGFARWTEWRTAEAPRLDRSELSGLEVEDLNGDGRADLVLVGSSRLRYALNAGDGQFGALVTLEASQVDGAIPVRSPTMTVLFADMNGSGSTDIVWIDRSGSVKMLELFPERPNLLLRVDNGLGGITAVEWSTMAAARARDLAEGRADAWPTPTPNAQAVVESLDAWVTLTGGEGGMGLHELRQLRYTGGFYDPRERTFRGFESVTDVLAPSDAVQGRRATRTWDLGREDPYRASLLLRTVVEATEPSPRVLRETRDTYSDCPVAEATSLDPARPVRFICGTRSEVLHREGLGEAEQLVTATERTYDGYGRVTKETRLGVVGRGSPEQLQACGPCALDGVDSGACGPTCGGDEAIEERTYARSSGRWILDALATVRRSTRAGGPTEELRHHYDGPAFAGLPLGTVERGARVRTVQLFDDDRAVDVVRAELDGHGQVVASLDALGQPTGGGHRQETTWDADGLHVVGDVQPTGDGYALRRTYSWDPVFDRPAQVSDVFMDGESAPRVTRHVFDAFGRLLEVYRPGDVEGQPSTTHRYELAAPVSRVVTSQRASADGSRVLESAACLDGAGRTYANLTRLDARRWLADGFVVFDRSGAPVRVYEPHEQASGACADRAPDGVRATQTRYDALGRQLARVEGDAAEYAGVATEERLVYRPLSVEKWVGEDLDPSAPTRETPVLEAYDGVGRLIRVERRFTPGADPAVTRLGYDPLGRVALRVDAEGHEKRQSYDRAGRVSRVEDPQSGETIFRWNDLGLMTGRTDAAGRAVELRYDGLNRLVERFDAARPDATRVTLRYDRDDACLPGGCAGGAGLMVSMSYPLGPELAAVVPGTGRDERTYDDRGRLVSDARRLGALVLEAKMTYDQADRLASTTLPGGQVIEWVRDGVGRVVEIPGVVSLDHGPDGLLRAVRHADGSAETYGWDARRELGTLATTLADGTSLAARTLTHDRSGRLVSIADARTSDPQIPAATVDARYDGQGRLMEAKLGTSESLDFEYDRAGVMTRVLSSRGAESTAHLGALDFAGPGLVSSAGPMKLQHDAAGFATQRGGAAVTYDGFGRMTHPAPGVTWSYGAGATPVSRIDADGLTLYGTPDFELRDGVAVSYVGSHARLESTATQAQFYADLAAPGESPSGSIDAGDAWLATQGLTQEGRVSEPRLLLAASARRLLVEARGDVTHLHTDQVSSVVFATRDGKRVGSRAFFPLGTLRAEDGFVDARGFAGQETDAASGLIRFGARVYDPASGHWLSPDPAFEILSADDTARPEESVQRFGYVGNGPLDGLDPTGLARREATKASAPRLRTANRSRGFGAALKRKLGRDPDKRFGRLPVKDDIDIEMATGAQVRSEWGAVAQVFEGLAVYPSRLSPAGARALNEVETALAARLYDSARMRHVNGVELTERSVNINLHFLRRDVREHGDPEVRRLGAEFLSAIAPHAGELASQVSRVATELWGPRPTMAEVNARYNRLLGRGDTSRPERGAEGSAMDYFNLGAQSSGMEYGNVGAESAAPTDYGFNPL